MRLTLVLIACTIAFASFAHGPAKPFDFRENKGQWHPDVLFQSNHGNATLYLEEHAMTWTIYHPEDFAAVHDVIKLSEEEMSNFVLRGHAFKVHFEGASTPNVVGQEANQGYYNYFIGNDSAKWASNVTSFNAVRYANIWTGIGMRMYSSSENLKYDFIVNAGANPDEVRLRYEGVDLIEVVDGQLVIHTSAGDIIEQAPYSYQMNGGAIEEVECHFIVEGDEVRFGLPAGYDASRTLVIDPVIIASTLSGSVGTSNYGHSAAFDPAGNIYTGAINFGGGYPTTTGAFQTTFPGGGGFSPVCVSVSKLNPTGTDLIWASYLGGGGADYPHSLIVNDQEELYVYGSTNSADFPTTTNAHSATNGGGADIFVTRFSASGANLLGSTYVGGSQDDGRSAINANYGDVYRGEIYLDVNDRPVVASFSRSANFPTSNGAYQSTLSGAQDAVLFCLNPTMTTLQYSTFLGGTLNDSAYGVRTTVDGEIYIVGGTESSNFPTTAGAYQTTFLGGEDGWASSGMDGFIAKFNPTATQLIACTFWATDENDQVFFVDLDNNDDVWVYGQSMGDIPVTDNVYSEENGRLFLSKFNPELTDLLVGTRIIPVDFFGSGGSPVAFLVDRCDNVYISNHSATSGLSLTDDAVFQTGGFYLAAYGPDCETLEFATYYTEGHVDGGTSRFDKSGIVYQGVCSGGNFFTNPDAWSSTQPGWDIGVFKMDFQVAGVNASLTASAEALNGCAPHTVDFNNYSVGNIFTWDFGDGSAESNEFEPSHTYELPGLYTVQLISMDSLSCNIADTAYVNIAVSVPQDFNPSFTFDLNCETFELTTNNTTDAPWLAYTWDLGDGTILEGENISHIYAEEGEYTISLLAEDLGCINDESVEENVLVIGAVLASTDAESYQGCGELEITFNNTSNGMTYEWDFGDGSPISTEENPTHTYTSPGEYEVILTAFHPESCNLEDQAFLPVIVGEEQDIEALFQLVQTDCEQFTVSGTNQSIGTNLEYFWEMGDGSTFETEDIEHNYASTGLYPVSLTITDPFCDYTDTYELDVNVLTEVTAIIGNADLEDCAPYTVQFTNNSAGSIFTWDFGDGSAPVETQVAEHVYEESGVYTVTLTVEGLGNCGGIDQTTATVTVIEPPFIDALFTMEQMGACEAMTVNFEDASTGDNLDYNWDVNGVIYSVANFEHVFMGPGTYQITLTVSEDLCDGSDVFSDVIEVLEGIDLQSVPDQFMCYYEDEKVIGVSGPEGATYEWNTGETTPIITVDQGGQYFVTATLNNCTDLRAIEVTPVAEMYLFNNPTACEGLSTLLRIPYDNGSNYKWCNGEEIDFIYASEAGEYCYEFVDEYGCLQQGEVVLDLIDKDAMVYIPNAFTPNNDGVNDVFKAYGEELREFSLSVWNRWGEKVFETDDPEGYWDGSYQGGDYYTQNEVYTWRVEYRGTCSAEKIERKGNVVLLR